MTYQDTLAAMADPTRRAILEMLRDGPRTVAELARRMPVSRPAVSQHLAVLSVARLVTHEKSGTRHLYQADPDGLQALRDYLEGVWGGMLGRFAAEAGKHASASSKTPGARSPKRGRNHARDPRN